VNWQVSFKKKAQKQSNELPGRVQEILRALVNDIGNFGPLRHNWKNFGKFNGTENRYHCHIKQGHPTYVVCWEVMDKKIKIVEVYYVGTHEKAPY